MKKHIVYTTFFFVAVMTMPCFGQTVPFYGTDLLEQGNSGGPGGAKTFDTEGTVSGEFAVDLWLCNIDCSTDMFTGGFWMEFDPAALTLVNVSGYSPPWSGSCIHITNNPAGPGTLMVTVCNLNGVSPDEDLDLIIGKVRFQTLVSSDTQILVKTIPDYTSWVCGSNTLDPSILTSTLNILAPVPCKADISGVAGTPDGRVDSFDLLEMKREFGRNNCP